MPENVTGLPGDIVSAGTVVGGIITAGVAIVTVGGTAVSLTIQVRSALRRSDWPAVSTAIACIVHSPS